jgi:hypothetical protein
MAECRTDADQSRTIWWRIYAVHGWPEWLGSNGPNRISLLNQLPIIFVVRMNAGTGFSI